MASKPSTPKKVETALTLSRGYWEPQRTKREPIPLPGISGRAGSIYASATDKEPVDADAAERRQARRAGNSLSEGQVRPGAHATHVYFPKGSTPNRRTQLRSYWFVEPYRGHDMIHHGGNIDGFSSILKLMPEGRHRGRSRPTWTARQCEI